MISVVLPLLVRGRTDEPVTRSQGWSGGNRDQPRNVVGLERKEKHVEHYQGDGR